ncbi:hypothetical protein B0H19DRAFT_1322512, partial [Mycena capillaripes]
FSRLTFVFVSPLTSGRTLHSSIPPLPLIYLFGIMPTFNASLFLFAALTFTHAAALPTNGATSTASASASSSSASSTFDFHCPSTDTDGVSLSGVATNGFNLTCSYDTDQEQFRTLPNGIQPMMDYGINFLDCAQLRSVNHSPD